MVLVIHNVHCALISILHPSGKEKLMYNSFEHLPNSLEKKSQKI